MSNLDPLTKEKILDEFKSIQRKRGITTIYVTHDQDEAISLGDRVSVLNQGRIEQTDTTNELFYNPKTKFVARFVGAKYRMSAQPLMHS
jgi:ABC-type sugar transport system ATPase subunit